MKKWQMANLMKLIGKKNDPDNRANLIARIDEQKEVEEQKIEKKVEEPTTPTTIDGVVNPYMEQQPLQVSQVPKEEEQPKPETE